MSNRVIAALIALLLAVLAVLILMLIPVFQSELGDSSMTSPKSASKVSLESDPKKVPTACVSVTSYWPYVLVKNHSDMGGRRYTDDLSQYTSYETNLAANLHEEGKYLYPAEWRATYKDDVRWGAYWLAIPWAGQADGSPEHTANGHLINPYEDIGKTAAAPLPFINKRIQIDWHNEILWINDTFGNQAYQDGAFYHYYYEQWVIGIDILSPIPLHYITCNWQIVGEGK